MRVDVTPVKPGPGKPAIALFVNGRQTNQGRIGRTVPFRYSVEPFDIGMDNVSAVTEDHKVPFAFKRGPNGCGHAWACPDDASGD